MSSVVFPIFEFTTEYGWQSVHFLMSLADKYDRLVDVHCDEIDDPASRNLEVLATEAYERGMKDRSRQVIRQRWDHILLILINYSVY